jgi:hypothetical protein
MGILAYCGITVRILNLAGMTTAQVLGSLLRKLCACLPLVALLTAFMLLLDPPAIAVVAAALLVLGLYLVVLLGFDPTLRRLVRAAVGHLRKEEQRA